MGGAKQTHLVTGPILVSARAHIRALDGHQKRLLDCRLPTEAGMPPQVFLVHENLEHIRNTLGTH